MASRRAIKKCLPKAIDYRLMEDIRSTKIEGEIKKIYLLEKKDIHNIQRDFIIAYSTKRHANDLMSVNIWV